MRRSLICAITTLAFSLVPGIVEAGIMCNWFGRCLYESPGFSFKVVDKETGQPLTDVHALAEWVQNGYYGVNGPLMVQDAVSGPEGVLAFPAWGPIRGSPSGLVLNHDPVISLFKTGYRTMLVTNAIPIGLEENDRVRGLLQDGQTFALELSRQDPEEMMKELSNAAYPPRLGGTSEDQITQFRIPYLNRKLRVWAEREKVPDKYRKPGQLFWHIERDIKLLREGSR